MEEGEDPPPVVGLSSCHSAPLLWRAPDLRAVRSQGVVGALLGSLPRTPRQNGRLGRPLLLLPEEERLLTEHRAAAALPDHDQVSSPEHSLVRVRRRRWCVRFVSSVRSVQRVRLSWFQLSTEAVFC